MAPSEKSVRERHVIKIDVEHKPNPQRRGGPGARRDTLFQPGKPYAFKKGRSGNPKVRPKDAGTKLIRQAYSVRLTDTCTLPGLEKLTWAEAIAVGLCRAAARGDTHAARELRETTEDRILERLNATPDIDYDAGKSAKELLMQQLGVAESEG